VSNASKDSAASAAGRSRAFVHRRRFGWPGTEPPEGRRPIPRYGAQVLALVALLLNAASAVEASAAVALVALVLGVPRGWTWANDRISAALWAAAALVLVAGEIAWLAGGVSAREAYGSHGQAGAAALLIGACTLLALGGFYRRWGTQGNIWVRSQGLRRGDPAARANVRARTEREGYVPRRDSE
jgi:hypothetical protein